MISMKLVILILIFNHIYSYLVEFAPTIIHEKKFAYVESNKNSMIVDHEKNALCDGYIVEFLHDATENYYERGRYAYIYFNNIKFPLYVLKVLKYCLFCLPMLVDSRSHKLFAHKIPMHRKWVRLKCASHMLHDASFMFQFFTFMRASWIFKEFILTTLQSWSSFTYFMPSILCNSSSST